MASPIATSERQRFAPDVGPQPGLVLLLDDEPLMLRSLRRILEADGHRTVMAESASEALPLLDDPALSVVLVDLFLGATSGLDFLEQVKRERPEVEVIVITAWSSATSRIGTPLSRSTGRTRTRARRPGSSSSRATWAPARS